MANFDTGSGAGTFRLQANLYSQNIALNQSTIEWTLVLYCYNGTSYNLSPPVGWSVGIGGVGYSGSYTFDFRAYNTKVIAGTAYTTLTHNPDGTLTAYCSGYTDHTGTSAIGGPIGTGGNLVLPQIPRGPKVEDAMAWRQSVAYVEDAMAWRQCLVYAEDGGMWKLAA